MGGVSFDYSHNSLSVVHRALNLAVVANNLGEESICDPSTLTAVQESICTVNRDVVYTIAQGVGVGLEQCQLRFATRRWNCSVAGPHYSYFVTAAGRGKLAHNSVTHHHPKSVTHAAPTLPHPCVFPSCTPPNC